MIRGKRRCKVCDEDFARQDNLVTHVETKHLGMAGHKCGVCGKHFASLRHLKSHLRIVGQKDVKGRPVEIIKSTSQSCAFYYVNLANFSRSQNGKTHKPQKIPSHNFALSLAQKLAHKCNEVKICYSNIQNDLFARNFI